MALKRLRKLSEELIKSNPWHDYRHDRFAAEDGREGDYFYVHLKGAAMIVPMTADRKLLLVNQYRYLFDRESLEFPCGGVREDEMMTDPEASFLKTAGRELEEETGYRGTLSEVGAMSPCNAVTDETCRLYIARDLVPGQSEPDPFEEFELAAMTPQELEQKIASGEIWDGMTIAAWQIVKPQLSDIL